MKKLIAALLLPVMLLLPSCSRPALQAGSFRHTHLGELAPAKLSLGVRADADAFDIDSVTLRLFFSTFEAGDSVPDGYYKRDADDVAVFAFYVCGADADTPLYGEEVADYKNIPGHIFIKELSDGDAFTDEYAFVWDFFGNIRYSHSESFTLPAESFTAESGIVEIRIVPYCSPDSKGPYMSMYSGSSISFEYEVSGGTVTLKEAPYAIHH